MSRKHAKNAISEPLAQKAEALDQIHDAEVLDAVGASGAAILRPVQDVIGANSVKDTATTPEPVGDPADVLSADIAKRVSYWATEIEEIKLPRRLFSSRRLFKDGIEIKGFKADLKLVYAFLLMLYDTAEDYADKNGQKDVAFTLAVPVGVIRDAFGLTEATTQRYLATLGNGQSKKTGENFFGLVEWKQGCKGFHIVNIHDLRFNDAAGFELK
ncbi:hypothetical protein LGH41_004451 [Escherichia coli]|nr:hypothetical protein [Escherichia coli]